VNLRLFLRILGTEAKKRLTYRLDFWLQAGAILFCEALFAWFVWNAVFAESGAARIAGLDLGGAMLYQVVAILVAKVVRGSEFTDQPCDDIYTGGYSRYLLYPVPYFGFKYAGQLGTQAPNVLQFALFAALAPLVFRSEVLRVDPVGFGLALGSVFVANLLYYVMSLALQGVSFWADNVWSLMVAQRLVSGVLGGALFPLDLFPERWRPVVDALPFRHFYAEPVATILGQRSFGAWALQTTIALAWTVGFALLARLVFRRGARVYTGVGI
jgi:ABC-2 type transport system permease protein